MQESDHDREGATRRWGRLALLLSSLLFVFVLGEVAVRLAIANARVPVERPPSGPAVPEEPDLPVFNGIMDLARKNVRGVHKGVLLRTNDHKLRGPDYAPQAAAGVVRILITGDSVTMGQGVAEEDTYAQQLERRLNADTGETRFEVLNAGISGADAHYAMERLEEAAIAYAPDLVIYGFTVNDIEGKHYVEVGKRGNQLKTALQTSPFARSPSHLVRVLWWQWQSMQDPPDPKENWYVEELSHNYFENPQAFADFGRALDRLAAVARAGDRCAMVFIHAHLSHLDERHPYHQIYDAVAAAAKARGLTVQQSFDAFEGRHPPDLWVGFFDPHPNAEGHALLAEQLAAGIEALPARCLAR